MAIDEKALGPEHPNVVTALSQLGSVLLDMGDITGARAAVERASDIIGRMPNAQHPGIEIVEALRKRVQSYSDGEAKGEND